MRSKHLARGRIRKQLMDESDEYDIEDIGQLESETEDEEKQPLTRKSAGKRPLLVLLGDEDGAEDAEKDEELDEVELNSKDECIRQINSAHHRKPRELRCVWGAQATNILLDLWIENRKELAVTGKKKIHIYKHFADKLKRFGPSFAEVKSKMDNMTRKYRLEAEKVRKNGQPSKWAYFHKVQSCLIGTNNVDVFNEIMFQTPVDSTTLNSATDAESDDETILNQEKCTEKNSQEALRKCSQKVIPSQPKNNTSNELEENEHTSCFSPVHETENTSSSPVNQRNRFTNEMDKAENLVYSSSVARKRRKIAHRLFEIEEEKLALEREQLKIMKETSEQVKFFYKDLIRLFKQK